jgi:LysM repeat protein
MDANERLLTRVVRERRGHAGLADSRPAWQIVLGVVLVLAAVAVGVRLLAAHGPAVSAPAVEDRFYAAPTAGAAAVSAPGDGGSAPAAESVPAAREPAATDGRPRRYVVRPGDTLQTIAERYGLRAATLASVNDVDDPDLLRPDLELVVPAVDGIVYQVKPGDTLRTIAEHYHVDIQTIIAANDLPSPDHITVGLRLFVPTATAGAD